MKRLKKKKLLKKAENQWLNLKMFFLVFIATIVFYRVLVIFIGDRSVYMFGTEIHHIFFGIFLLIISGFIRFFAVDKRLIRFDLIFFAIGTGTVVDQIAYIIFTPGDHISYFSGVSFFGMLFITAVLTGIFYVIYRRIAND